MGKKRVLVSYGVDVDAVSGWLGSYGGEDSANDISRGGKPIMSHVALPFSNFVGSWQGYSPALLAHSAC